MAHFETVMDIGQKFWIIRNFVVRRSGKKINARMIDEYSVEEIRIYGADNIGYVYDIFNVECYGEFSEEDIGTKIFLSEEDAKLALSRNEATKK